ncbi:class III lanthipeptide [Kitasatospora sp. MMS16-BH015]|nr:class III lanthipeptide [Kitasatospora sp. MMS16-BH015]
MNAVIALQSLEESAQGTELLPITGLGSAFSYYSRCSTTCG